MLLRVEFASSSLSSGIHRFHTHLQWRKDPAVLYRGWGFVRGLVREIAHRHSSGPSVHGEMFLDSESISSFSGPWILFNQRKAASMQIDKSCLVLLKLSPQPITRMITEDTGSYRSAGRRLLSLSLCANKVMNSSSMCCRILSRCRTMTPLTTLCSTVFLLLNGAYEEQLHSLLFHRNNLETISRFQFFWIYRL